MPGLVAGFCMIELDRETGQFEIKEYLGVADCGTVLHPEGLQTQIFGGSMMGFGLATTERIVYDHQLGLPANVQFDQAKPKTYLDMPKKFQLGGRRSARPRQPCRREGHRRTHHGSCRGGVDQRHLRRARRHLLPPHAGGPRHDRQRACRSAAIL